MLKRKTLIGIALLLAMGYVAAAVITDADRLSEALRRLGWLGCIAVLGLSALNYGLRFLRWRGFIARLGRQVPATRHILYYLGGFAFTISPAKAGEALRSLYLRDHGVTYAESLAALFVERLLDLFAMVVLASLMAFDHPAYRFLVMASFLIVIALIVVVCQSWLPRAIDKFATRRQSRFAKVLDAFANLLRSSRLLLHPNPLIPGSVIGLLSWGAEGLGFAVICQVLGLGADISAFIGIYAIAILAGSAAFFLPAGIGGTEIVMTTLLVERGADLRVAVIATLLCRLATLWFAVLLGVGAASIVEISTAKIPRSGTT